MIAPAGFRRPVLFSVMGAFVAGVLILGFSVVHTLTASNLGTGFIKLVKEDFVPSNLVEVPGNLSDLTWSIDITRQ